MENSFWPAHSLFVLSVSTDEHKDNRRTAKKNFLPPQRRSYPWKAFFNENGFRPLFLGLEICQLLSHRALHAVSRLTRDSVAKFRPADLTQREDYAEGCIILLVRFACYTVSFLSGRVRHSFFIQNDYFLVG